MNFERNIQLLEKLIKESNELNRTSNNSPEFKSWRILVERTLIKVFGETSLEVREFKNLGFGYRGVRFGGKDYSSMDQNHYYRDLKISIETIKSYIEEFKEDSMQLPETLKISHGIDTPTKKIFISHAHKDRKIVGELIEILEALGLGSERIFCTSFSEYGIPMGENFLERIKTELNSESLVLFLLSNNFYESAVCLCEMGAAWVLTKEHIPILIPPFDFKDIAGVIPMTQGFKINDASSLNIFKEKVEKFFELPKPLNFSTWERKRDNILARINEEISKINALPNPNNW